MPSPAKTARIPVIVTLALLVVSRLISPAPASAERSRAFQLPAHAVQVAPGLFDLGTAVDEGRSVRGYAWLEPAPRGARAAAKPGGGTTSTCYAFLARGAKWKTVEPYLVDPDGVHVDTSVASQIQSHIAASAADWEAASGRAIFGNEGTGAVDGADETSTDGKNEVLFAPIAGAGTIAVTIVWGVFGGPTQSRQLVEWDQVYDDDGDWTWGDATVNSSFMDFRSISEHEVGHAAGMDHPGLTCSLDTMYAYAGTGETLKRTLFTGDIAGIRALYP